MLETLHILAEGPLMKPVTKDGREYCIGVLQAGFENDEEEGDKNQYQSRQRLSKIEKPFSGLSGFKC